MIRTALWLISEIGVGNSFTKEQHRQAFSGVTQADRRLRDLRDYGWVIHTSAEDLTLNPEEQRFFAAGRPVWELGVHKNTATDAVTAKMRKATLAENDYQCVFCGICSGVKAERDSHSRGAYHRRLAKRNIEKPEGGNRETAAS
jgi:hypothetical protein